MTVIPDANKNAIEDDGDDGMAERNLCPDEYVNMEDGRRCRCLTCKPGFKPHRCNTMDPDTSYCEPCPKNQYTHNSSILGRTETCRYWKKCDQPHMFLASPGGPTYDVKCGCNEGYHFSEKSHTCVYYDPTKVNQAKRRTFTRNDSRRDREKAQKQVADTEDTRKNSDTTTSPFTQSPIKGDKVKGNNAALADSSNAGANWKVIAPVLALSLIVFIIVAVILYWRRRRQPKPPGHLVNANANEQTHLLEKSIQDISDRDLHGRVLSVCFKEVGLKIGRDWKKLGQHLLHDKLDYALEGTADSSIEEKTFQILTNWQQNLGHSATTKVLLDTLRSMRRQDIIHHLCDVVHDDPELGSHFHRDNPHEDV